jgi:C1A family cysteine protease
MHAFCKNVTIHDVNETFGTGWLPPMPDLRDYSADEPAIKAMAKKLGIHATAEKPIPDKMDLRKWCSPIENQLTIGSCSAHAGTAMVEYFQKRANGTYIPSSRLFLYKTTRNLMQVTGDTGAWLRSVMGALALCGVAPEKFWPYKIEDYDKEPPAFLYAIADNYEALKYFCHDATKSKIGPDAVLASVKKYLAAGIPSMFGIWGFNSINNTDVKGGIPYPCPGESAQWGHAIATVGYDDTKKIKNTQCGAETTGALLIRNSWGKEWGEDGYGWLPYEYVLNKLAIDFWSILGMEWIDTKNFGI